MHAPTIVARVLAPCVKNLHRKQAHALLRASAGLLIGCAASLSSIALRVSGLTSFKHRLKSVDRLLGNSTLHSWRWQLYRQVAACWLGDLSSVLMVIDWSDLTRDQRLHLLRASIAVQGRSITLYEEVHPQKHFASPRVHRAFLQRVALMLPSGCKPVVMTDAGFHSPWFKLMNEMGWDFIGRVRGQNQLRDAQSRSWCAARELFARAQGQARDLGCDAYARSNPVTVRAVLAKRPKKHRHALNIYGAKRRGRVSLKNAQSAREPWLLVCSLGLSHLSPEGVVALYGQRMQIEQSFRDTKNLRVGMGLCTSRCTSARRLEMLLLLVHLVTFVQRIVGEYAKQNQLELQFMARRRADRSELSTITLGRRIIATGASWLNRFNPRHAIEALCRQAASHLEAT